MKKIIPILGIFVLIITLTTSPVYATHGAAADCTTIGDTDGAPLFEVCFENSSFDGSETTFEYQIQVIAAGPPALSHISFEIMCPPNPSAIMEVFPTTAESFIDAVEIGALLGDGIPFGIKWEEAGGIDYGESLSDPVRDYSYTVDGNIPTISNTVVVKGGGPTSGYLASGPIPGPDCNGIPPSGNGLVGGEFLSIDSTALLLAGLQSSVIWMLPVLAGAAGIGIAAFKIRQRI